MKHAMLFFAILLAAMLIATTGTAQIQLTAALSSAEEVPVNATTGNGTGSFVLNEDRTILTYVVTYQGLTGTLTAGGHFHTGTPGKTGPVVKGIAVSGDPASNTISGTWKTTDLTQPLTSALVESLLTGRMYVNFHTAANPGGEIRGQVKLGTALEFTADLDGTQETPANSATGTGTGVFVLSTDRKRIDYAVAYQGLSGTLTAGGHVHTGAVGKAGGIVKGIAVSGDPASGRVTGSWRDTNTVQPLTQAIIDSLMAGKLYVNFHTAANPGGEIRGQLQLAGGTGFMALLDSSQETPSTASSGLGVGYLVLNALRSQARYAVTYFGLTGTLTAGGHIHTGTPGRSGPVVKGIAFSGGPAATTILGTWTASDAQPLTIALAESLLSGKSYVNFHTESNPGGEIRGRINLATGVGFSVALDGSQETPPTNTNAKASGFAILNAERNDVSYQFTYQGLSGTLTAGGHIHTGKTGVTGPVVKGIAVSGDPASATVSGDWSAAASSQALSSALVDSILAGKTYVNFHTAANPGGEIRGQLAFPSSPATSVEQGSTIMPSTMTLQQNYPNPFNPSTTITFQVPAAGPVVVRVYNILGQQVSQLINNVVAPGSYSVKFDGTSFASGPYLYELRDGFGHMLVKRMLLVK